MGDEQLTDFAATVRPAPKMKKMKLRYAGSCRQCQTALAAGTLAIYDQGQKQVICLSCDTASPADESAPFATQSHAEPEFALSDVTSTSVPVVQNPEVRPLPNTAALQEPGTTAGTAGASALREYERRKDKREKRIRQAHPKLGGLILALSDDPPSTRAWQTGSVGEQRLGDSLDALAGDGVLVLHDRRIPRTRANIDHIAVGPAGIYVIDAKRYRGKRPQRRVDGGLFRPRVEKLIIGGRDHTNLLDGTSKQVDLVRAAALKGGLTEVAVRGMLCFVDSDWPLIGGSFQVRGFDVLWPRLAMQVVRTAGPLDAAQIRAAHQLLAASFPPA